jgi:hypothetical protein
MVVPFEAFLDTDATIRRVLERRGLVREGISGFTFQHEAPEEVAEGVAIVYFDDESVVSERFFVEFVLASVSALEELSRASGRPMTGSYGADLALLQQRLAEGHYGAASHGDGSP